MLLTWRVLSITSHYGWVDCLKSYEERGGNGLEFVAEGQRYVLSAHAGTAVVLEADEVGSVGK